MATKSTRRFTHYIAQIDYPSGVYCGDSGVADAALTEHVIAQVTAARADARVANLALVAVICEGTLAMHVHEDPRTAQVVARAVGRVEADIALIVAEANDCARVVMDCGIRVAMVTPRGHRAAALEYR